jgi:hypothetical protein
MTFVETLADRIPAVSERVIIPACEMVERLDKLPPAPGYEPMLIERGHHPLMARGLSHWIIRSGKEEANKAKMQRIVVDDRLSARFHNRLQLRLSQVLAPHRIRKVARPSSIRNS